MSIRPYYSWRGVLLYSVMVWLTSTHDEVYCYTSLWSDWYLLMTRCTVIQRYGGIDIYSWRGVITLHLVMSRCQFDHDDVYKYTSSWVDVNPTIALHNSTPRHDTTLWSDWHLLMTRCTVIQRYGRIDIYSWRGVLLYSAMVWLTSTHDKAV
jgi:hypothetical protein